MEKEISSKVNVTHKHFIRWSLLTAGTVFVGLGILGMFLPLLPTTVFFLMAAWCYARSSKKLYDWLHHNKYFGKYLKNYREGRGISLASKISTVIILWSGIGYSIVVTESLIIHLVLLAIAIGVTLHIILIPTHKPE